MAHWHTIDGDETFKVRAVDSRGNIGNTFIVDMNVNRPPEVSVNTASITVDALGTADISTIFSVLDLDQDEIKNSGSRHLRTQVTFPALPRREKWIATTGNPFSDVSKPDVYGRTLESRC